MSLGNSKSPIRRIRTNPPDNGNGNNKRGPGRPTKYREHYPDIAYDLALTGIFFETDLAVAFGVPYGTLRNWKEDHPEFRAAVKKGERSYWINLGTSLATSGKNAGWCMFMLKTRHGYRETSIIEEKPREITHRVKIDWSGISTEELRALRNLPIEVRRKLIQPVLNKEGTYALPTGKSK